MQEFDTRWDEILLSMEQFPPDDILESLYKLRTRESEKLKTVLELCNSDIHQKKAKPEYPRLTSTVKRSFEQNLRTRIFEARNGEIESGISVKNQREQRCVHKGQGECWQWKANGQRSKGDKCSFRHDGNKRAEPTPPPAPSSETSTPQDVRNPAGSKKSWRPKSVRENISSVVQGTSQRFLHQSVLWKVTFPRVLVLQDKRVDADLLKSALMRRLINGLAKGLKRLVTKVQWLCWRRTSVIQEQGDLFWMLTLQIHDNWVLRVRGYGAAEDFIDFAEELKHFEAIRCVQFTKAVLRHASIRDQKPSLGMNCPGDPHQRSPNSPKFEDRSQEETEWQEQGAREAAWKLAKSVFKLKEQQRATFFSPSENRCLPASNLKLEEREFVVDSGASMHMINRKDLNSAELEAVPTSRSPTTVITANGEVQTNEEAIVYVKELDIFLTVKLLEDIPAVLSLGKLCVEHGYSYEWINSQANTPVSQEHLELSNVDFASSNGTSSLKWPMLYIFEDNEAVISMIIKGRRPAQRRFQDPQSCSWLVVRQK